MTYSMEQIKEWIREKQALGWIIGEELIQEIEKLEEENDKLHSMISRLVIGNKE